MDKPLLKGNRLVFPHFPVLLSEVIENLKPENDKRYLDCTFGAGGHTKAILDSANCFVKAIDQDPSVYQYAKKISNQYKKRFKFVQGNFANIKEILNGERYDGILLDLGVSSMQLDKGERGFSFIQDGNLNMRMSNSGYSAADFIADTPEKRIAEVIYEYGQEKQSRRIARMIVHERQKKAITTTFRLANIIRRSMLYYQERKKIDPATKTFQAIRIYVNKELENLKMFLLALNDILNVGGRILIISFHSLEDNIVKSFFKENALKRIATSKYTQKELNFHSDKWLKIISQKPILPNGNEVKENPRSRSARLRVSEKIKVQNANF